jgi:hypothetical protein
LNGKTEEMDDGKLMRRKREEKEGREKVGIS